ncbi:glycosyltransferase family 4 protein [soil metagenome]
MTTGIILAAIGGALSYALTGVVRSYALRHDLLDRPNDRSSHDAPTPRGGGIAMIAATLACIAIGVVLGLVNARDALILGIGMFLVGAIGWLDDRRGLRADVRLGVHFAVALWTLYMFRGLPAVRVGTASLSIGGAGYVLGALGIVWSINLFNFMDGIDGLAGSQAALIFASTALLLFSRGDDSLGTIALVLASASAGFLVWNWPPAKIFLGDSGSGAIGYAVASLAVASENHGSVPLIVVAIICGVFISDATVTLLRRIGRGNRPTEAHRDHAYQRLARAWGSHRSVSWRAAAVTALLAALGAVGTLVPRLVLPAVLVALLLLSSLLLATERRTPM